MDVLGRNWHFQLTNNSSKVNEKTTSIDHPLAQEELCDKVTLVTTIQDQYFRKAIHSGDYLDSFDC